MCHVSCAAPRRFSRLTSVKLKVILMKVLVTGGCGFIGSNLVKKLHDLDVTVVSVDNMSSSRDDAGDFMASLPDVEFINNCFSSARVLERVKSKEFDAVFHVAAIPRVSFSVENPSITTDTNINKTVKLLEACVNNTRRFVFSSSSSVYGGADVLPTPVGHVKNPKSPYAWQKSATEDLIRIFCEIYPGFDAVCLRYFNVFGPGQFGGSAYSTAISAWCHSVKNNLELRKDGTGEQSRDLCYIDNVVDANVLSMRYSEKFSGETFNVACGDRISNNEILNHFKEKFGNLSIRQAPFRPGDVMHTQADISATVTLLDYKPKVRFWEGLKRTFDWWEI